MNITRKMTENKVESGATRAVRKALAKSTIHGKNADNLSRAASERLRAGGTVGRLHGESGKRMAQKHRKLSSKWLDVALRAFPVVPHKEKAAALTAGHETVYDKAVKLINEEEMFPQLRHITAMTKDLTPKQLRAFNIIMSKQSKARGEWRTPTKAVRMAKEKEGLIVKEEGQTERSTFHGKRASRDFAKARKLYSDSIEKSIASGNTNLSARERRNLKRSSKDSSEGSRGYHNLGVRAAIRGSQAARRERP